MITKKNEINEMTQIGLHDAIGGTSADKIEIFLNEYQQKALRAQTPTHTYAYRSNSMVDFR